MPVTRISTPPIFMGVAYYQYAGQGLSHKWLINPAAITSGQPIETLVRLLAVSRLYTMGKTAILRWCRISDALNEKKEGATIDGLFNLTNPPPATPDPNVLINDFRTSIKVRCETADRSWVNYGLRFCPDNVVNDAQFKGTVTATLAPGAALPDEPTASSSYADAFGAYFRFIRDFTLLGRPLNANNEPKKKGQAIKAFDTETFTKVMITGVGKRETGRPFGQLVGRRPKLTRAASRAR